MNINSVLVKYSDEVEKKVIHRKINNSDSRARFEGQLANKMDDYSE